MDTKLKKSDSAIITKILCFVLAVAVAALGAVSVIGFIDSAYEDSDFTYNKLIDAVEYGSAQNMYEKVMKVQLMNYLSDLDYHIKRYDNGSKEKYNELMNAHKGAAENLKEDIIYHVRTNAFEAKTEDNGNKLENILSLYYDGCISLELIESGNINITRYVGSTLTVNVDDVDITEYYYEFFLDEPEMYYNGSWDDLHAETTSVNAFEKNFPAEIKKIAKEKGFDGVIYVNAELIDDYHEIYGEDVTHATLYGGTVPGFEANTVIRGFYGFKVNEELVKNSIYSVPYSSYEEFYSDYKESAEYIEKNYGSAYFAAVADGKVISANLKGITKNSTEKQLSEIISEYDFAAVFNGGWKVIKSDIELPNLDRYTDISNTYYFGINPLGKNGSEPFSQDLSQSSLSSVEKVSKTISKAIITVCMSFAVCMALTVILVIKSGRYKTDDDLHLLPLDNMFFELRFVIDGGIIGAVGWFIICAAARLVSNNNSGGAKALCAIGAAIIASLLLDLILYISRNLKNRSLHTRFILVWFFTKVLKKAAAFAKEKNKNFINEKEALKEKYKHLADVQKDAIIKIAVLLGINLFLGFWLFSFMEWNDGDMVLITGIALLAVDCFAGVRILRFLGAVKGLFKEIEKVRNGEENLKINKQALPASFHKAADDLMSINDGIKLAVEKAMQNEKMKTELITNVSHDLKTPLTSIINYVDLLQKCDIQNETAESYLQVLSEKSDRLKHLIEDLVEASKASAGAVNVNAVSVSLQEFINQLLGEHSEGLCQKKLTVVVNIPEQDIILKADSNLLYRVLENLVVNIKKYALQNTRVYISAQKLSSSAVITFKNISAEQLNMTPQELMSRFVRGDTSRSTHGNGLGLSIAESLCELMGGKLQLKIDGDLFTATVEMPLEKQ